jgi:RNA polymerase sigma-70 factor (ECF subfamily)
MLKKKSQLNDEELFFLVKKNDANALKLLYKRYYDKLCHFAYGYVQSRDISKDVVSEVFLNIWLKRATLNIASSLKSYFYKSTRNKAIRILSKEKSNWEKLKIVDELNIFANNSPFDKIQYKELENVIEAMLKKLPPKRQIVFRLNRVDGLSYKEISEILSISVYTVQNHMVKAMKYINEEYPKIKRIIILLLFFTFQKFLLFSRFLIES